ncbi:MAG: phosphotyrosine protein phosphatase [Betaproteobacteria bacterium]
MTRVLFVCMGNICRSPTAEGCFVQHLKMSRMERRFVVDSAGTHAHHVGEAPDARAQLAAKRRGIDISRLAARRVVAADFERFDLILAMDRENLRQLARQCPPQHVAKLGLLMRYASRFDQDEVPDPYYGGVEGFERVLDLVQDATAGLLRALVSGTLPG